MFNKNKGILGLNARNVLYVNKLNRKSAIKFANSKLKTKNFLSARGIPVPRLYRVAKSHEDIQQFDFGSLPGNVVLKPNLGSQGKGIIPFKERNGSIFTTVSGKEYDTEQIKNHMTDIIDGKFSMGNIRDTAFFEQLIINHKSLAKYTWAGLPDIRVIVHNLIPVMAMLRLPTKESGGRANLSQGALGIGLDIATGKPTHISYKNKIVDSIPEIGEFDKDFKIPFWDDILEISSKCQYITNLGYIGCDIALDDANGPILIEINARPGTKIQIANKAPLGKRLLQSKNITVKSPQKGVRLGKDLFGKKDTLTNKKNNQKIVHIQENIELNIDNKKINLKAKVDLNEDRTILHTSYKQKDSKKTIKIIINGHKIVSAPIYKDLEGEFKCILGAKDLQDFLVKPTKKEKTNKIAKLKTKKQTKQNALFYLPQVDFGQVDHQVYQALRNVKLISKLTPVNLKEEMAKFDKDNTYNPQFIYNQDYENIIEHLQNLSQIKTDDSILGRIFQVKIEEIINTLRLIEHIGTESLNDFSFKIYPKPTQVEIDTARTLLINKDRYSKGKKYYSDQRTAKIFSDFLKKNNLNNWKVQIKENMIAACSVNKSNTIFIKKGSKFHENRIKKLIAHEIETHIFTAENGKRQPYKIFQHGTANYLTTQEGLAIYNQERSLDIFPNNYFAAGNMIACDVALNNSFAESVHILTTEKKLGEKAARNLTLKTKRGLSDTSKKGGIAKQAIYTRGALMIDNFVKQGGNLSELYIGKISLDILDDCKKINSLNPPIYIPSWY